MIKEKSLLHPKNDVVFKAIFGTNIDILAKLLLSIIDLPEDDILELRYVNTNQIYYPDTKLTILDIKVVTKFGNIIDV